jgi:T4 gene Gp59 loader of gp41 DNA helicase
MTGYETFCLYSSLKLHFNSDSYDYFKYNGKVSTSIGAFENRKDKWHFYKLSRRFTNVDICRDFVVANLVSDQNVWVGHLLTNEADAEYRKRQKVIQSLTYTFTNEIESLMNHSNPNDLFMSHEGEYPDLLIKLLHEEVSLETICILNQVLGFLSSWDRKIGDTIHYPNISKRIKKYTPFIPFEPTKYKLILKKEYDANTENLSGHGRCTV